MSIIRSIANKFEKEAAEKLAKKLNIEDDMGWTYRAQLDPQGTGRYLIEMFDETEYFIGNL